MGILITTEEWAALMGTEPVPSNKGLSARQKKPLHFENIRMAATESAPTRSLRDLISNEEIAALLSWFSEEFVESTPAKLKKARAHKRYPAKPALGRQIHAKP
jgi:hypothetical protein